MATLAEFLRGLLEDGRVLIRSAPGVDPGERPEAVAILGAAFEDHRLDVAGPPIAFDPAAALASADFVRLACWYLVDRSEPPDRMARRLVVPPAPVSASGHLSSDLTLRFLPRVARRARALGPVDGLRTVLAEVIRRFPLSGVLADLDPGPGDPGAFGGHPGLALLNAERLGSGVRDGWRPSSGSAAAGALELLASTPTLARSRRF